MTYARLVKAPDQVAANADRFQALMEGPETPAKGALVATIPHFKSWIAVRKGEEFVLAPSKWVGYANMDPDFYAQHHHDQLDGRETERAMAPWLQPVGDDHPLWEQLWALCRQHGKKPNGRCRISILLTDTDTENAANAGDTKNLTELLVAVIRSLPANEQQEIRRRLAP